MLCAQHLFSGPETPNDLLLLHLFSLVGGQAKQEILAVQKTVLFYENIALNSPLK